MDKEQLITLSWEYEDGTKVTQVYLPEWDGPLENYENSPNCKVIKWIAGTDPYIRKDE